MDEAREKAITFLGTSYDDLLALSKPARREIGYQLHLLQQEEDPSDSKAMRIIGSGVREIRVKEGSQYRVIYVAKFAEAVYVIHVFEKKDNKTRQGDINIAKTRLRDLIRERRKVS